MYVQQEPLLLFRRTDKNCYINIIEHSLVKTITSMCTYLYYHKITVHASLVTTSHFFYLLNINDELKITCYGRQTTCRSHSVSIIKRTGACDCVIQSVEIQLIGSHSNCKDSRFKILMVTSSFNTPSILSLNGSITKPLCLIIGKTNIYYLYQVKPAYLTSVSTNLISQVCLVTTLFHLSQLSS